MFPKTYWPTSFWGKDYWPGEQVLAPPAPPAPAQRIEPTGGSGVLGRMPKYWPEPRGDTRKLTALAKAEKAEEEEAVAITALMAGEWE